MDNLIPTFFPPALTNMKINSLAGGHLSGRMQASNNLWHEMWRAAKPVPAWRQKRLFDDTKEAEKILHTFSSLRLGQVATLLLPAVFHASAHRLLDELSTVQEQQPAMDEVKAGCRQFISKTGHITRHAPLEIQQYEVVFPFPVFQLKL